MPRYTLFLLLLCMIALTSVAQKKPANGRSTDNYVWVFDKKGNLQRFASDFSPKIEVKNGNMNIAVVNAANEIFQLTGIPVSCLKDTVIRKSAARVILMKKAGTFVTQPKSTPVELTIRCAQYKKGAPVNMLVRSRVYNGTSWYSVESRVNGLIPGAQSVTTNTTNTTIKKQ